MGALYWMSLYSAQEAQSSFILVISLFIWVNTHSSLSDWV